MLIAFGGRPGTGKTTLARAIAQQRRATYLRIDTIEQSLRNSDTMHGDVGPAGYIVAYAIAEANLRLGGMVVADSVNPLTITRDAWRDLAARASARIAEIEIICSNPAEHRLRVETREIDVAGLTPPTWAEVLAHDYAPWHRPRIVIDTANRSISDALAELGARIRAHEGP